MWAVFLQVYRELAPGHSFKAKKEGKRREKVVRMKNVSRHGG